MELKIEPVDVLGHQDLEVDHTEFVSRDESRDGILHVQSNSHRISAFRHEVWDVVLVANLENALTAKALK